MTGIMKNEAQQIYERACEYVRSGRSEVEVAWHRNTDFPEFSEQELLREAAWVILCSGFREATVRRSFDHVSLCFCDFESSQSICEQGWRCVAAAKVSINNPAKLNAISACASLVHAQGFASFKKAVVSEPLSQLQKLPFIGPVTVWHLAKNLGLDVAKPDRHLVRMANHCGFSTVADLCCELADKNSEQVKVVDLILWRYLADFAGKSDLAKGQQTIIDPQEHSNCLPTQARP